MVKKFLAATAATTLIALAPASAAFAHHDKGGHKNGNTSCLAACDVDVDKNKVFVKA